MDDKKGKIPLKTRICKTLKKWLLVILNPKLLLCLFIAWMITNGGSYFFTALGTALDITWMTVAGTAYMGLLWVPFTPEKILTVVIAIFLMRLLFPRRQSRFCDRNFISSKKHTGKVRENDRSCVL